MPYLTLAVHAHVLHVDGCEGIKDKLFFFCPKQRHSYTFSVHVYSCIFREEDTPLLRTKIAGPKVSFKHT